MVENLYLQIRDEARKIASDLPEPSFYRDHKTAYGYSLNFFNKDRELNEIKSYVRGKLENNFGHGYMHAKKVALDAGAIMIVEKGEGMDDRQLLLIQTTGLMHDIIRKKKDHALKSAEFTEKKLRDFPFKKKEIDSITKAIRNHEAFKKNDEAFDESELLISNCLYDADKFRWGPDNFTHTVWDMVLYSDVPVKDFMQSYPKGIESLHYIKETFRSKTGKKYGPEFIDLGLEIGERLLKSVRKNHPGLF